jgi:hypothetical protein
LAWPEKQLGQDMVSGNGRSPIKKIKIKNKTRKK